MFANYPCSKLSKSCDVFFVLPHSYFCNLSFNYYCNELETLLTEMYLSTSINRINSIFFSIFWKEVYQKTISMLCLPKYIPGQLKKGSRAMLRCFAGRMWPASRTLPRPFLVENHGFRQQLNFLRKLLIEWLLYENRFRCKHVKTQTLTLTF